MKELKLQKLWLLVGLSYIVVIFYLCLKKSGPPIVPPFPNLDKLFHFSAYFFLMSYFTQILNKTSYKIAFVVFLAMGVLIEFLQLQTGYRSFEVLDMLANTIGLVVGWFIFGNKFSDFLTRLESYLNFNNT